MEALIFDAVATRLLCIKGAGWRDFDAMHKVSEKKKLGLTDLPAEFTSRLCLGRAVLFG